MPTLTSDSTASPRWGGVPFFGVRSGAPRTRRPPPSSSGSQGHGGCGWPLDHVAGWVGGGIAAVFFASLERCSCVNVRTHDDDLLDDEQRDSEAPLMFDDDGSGNSTAGIAGVERRRGGRRSDDKAAKRSRGGMGCYGDF